MSPSGLTSYFHLIHQLNAQLLSAYYVPGAQDTAEKEQNPSLSDVALRVVPFSQSPQPLPSSVPYQYLVSTLDWPCCLCFGSAPAPAPCSESLLSASLVIGAPICLKSSQGSPLKPTFLSTACGGSPGADPSLSG